MSVLIKVGMCQCQNPTIHNKVQLGPVGSGKLFNMPTVLRHNISAQLGPSDPVEESQFPCDNLFNVFNVAPTYGQVYTI